MDHSKKEHSRSKITNRLPKPASSILVAEDDRVTLNLLAKNLRSWGYEVLTAENGQQAWKLLKRPNLQIAILDWMMPGLEGPELCHQLRQLSKPRYTYLILLTSRDSSSDLIQGLEAGADDYMTKPINLMELRARLKTAQRIIELEDNLIKVRKMLSRLASTDSLTGVWNRRKFMRYLKEEFNRAQREGRSLGVLMVDMDNFKEINDRYGHPAGDLLLRQLAQLIRHNLRNYDRIARYGGDEFILLLPGSDNRGTQTVADRLLHLVRQKKFRTGTGMTTALNLSIGGTATGSARDLDPKSAVRTADRALYQAKKAGRGRAVVIDYEPGEKQANKK